MRRIISTHLVLCLQVNCQTQCWFYINGMSQHCPLLAKFRNVWQHNLEWHGTNKYGWGHWWEIMYILGSLITVNWFTGAVCQIIKDRVYAHVSRNKFMWNSLPGGLLVLPEYSIHLAHYPFYYLNLGKHKEGIYKLCNMSLSQYISQTFFSQ